MIPFIQKSANQFLNGKVSRFFLFFFLLITSDIAATQWQEVQPLDKSWLVYQANMKAFLPYISSKHYNYKSKSLAIPLAEYPNTYLRLEMDEEYVLFVQGAFHSHLKKEEVYSWSMDSLQARYPINGPLYFSFYRANMAGIPQGVSIERKVEENNTAFSDMLNLRQRNAYLFNQFFGSSFLLILFFLGVLYAAFPRYFAAYFRFTDWIHWEIKEEVLLKNAFAFPNLLVIFLLSLITACFSFYNGLLNQSQDSFFESQENLQRFVPAIGFVLSKTLLGFGLFVSRYFVYKLFTNLFRLPHIADAHYFKSIQANLQFFIVLFSLLSLFSVYMGPMYAVNLNYISYLITGYFFVRAIYFFQVFRRTYQVNQLSLLAYLILMEGQVMVFGLRELIFPEYM
ncbi:MAG: hypothetical protein RLZZ185_558 [Bacteroidota bacterium]|jgi:hypothetical protein